MVSCRYTNQDYRILVHDGFPLEPLSTSRDCGIVRNVDQSRRLKDPTIDVLSDSSQVVKLRTVTVGELICHDASGKFDGRLKFQQTFDAEQHRQTKRFNNVCAEPTMRCLDSSP